jgi:hypothetical protein
LRARSFHRLRALALIFSAALSATVRAAPLPALSESACLVIEAHRSGEALARLPLADVDRPQIIIAFEHSVLGTTVQDHYEWRTQNGNRVAWLIQEHFRGEGYGLPHVATEGERLVRDGDAWQLHLNRKVEPLVVRPLRAQRMRVIIAGKEFLLSNFNLNGSEAAQQLHIGHC